MTQLITNYCNIFALSAWILKTNSAPSNGSWYFTGPAPSQKYLTSYTLRTGRNGPSSTVAKCLNACRTSDNFSSEPHTLRMTFTTYIVWLKSRFVEDITGKEHLTGQHVGMATRTHAFYRVSEFVPDLRPRCWALF